MSRPERHDRRVSFNARIRRLLRIRSGGTLSSSLRNASQLDVYGVIKRPGPFDTPPAEPVRILGPVPWELQEGHGTIADWVNVPRDER
jgi:hypothetical protein